MIIIGLKDMCSPAHFYLIVSIIAWVLMAIQNASNSHVYCIGNYSCSTTSTFSIFIFKLVYIIFWTWLLNIICKSGYTYVSWALVLIPYILLFLIIASGVLATYDTSRYTSANYYYRAVTG